MTDTVLLVIDAQQSFYHRGYNEAAETPAFEQALSTLIAAVRRKAFRWWMCSMSKTRARSRWIRAW